MSRAAVLLVVLGLAGCAHRPAGWAVAGEPVDAAWRQTALELADCIGQASKVREWSRAGWGGTIEVAPAGPMPCDRWPGDTAQCAGWTDPPDRVRVSWTPDPLAGALAHELAHAALCRPTAPGTCSQDAADALAAAGRECLAGRMSVR